MVFVFAKDLGWFLPWQATTCLRRKLYDCRCLFRSNFFVFEISSSKHYTFSPSSPIITIENLSTPRGVIRSVKSESLCQIKGIIPIWKFANLLFWWNFWPHTLFPFSSSSIATDKRNAARKLQQPHNYKHPEVDLYSHCMTRTLHIHIYKRNIASCMRLCATNDHITLFYTLL